MYLGSRFTVKSLVVVTRCLWLVHLQVLKWTIYTQEKIFICYYSVLVLGCKYFISITWVKLKMFIYLVDMSQWCCEKHAGLSYQLYNIKTLHSCCPVVVRKHREQSDLPQCALHSREFWRGHMFYISIFVLIYAFATFFKPNKYIFIFEDSVK